VDKNGDMKNRVRVEMNQFNFIVIEKATEEIANWKSKFVLEEGGEHHNLVGVGCWDILTGGRAPLQHLMIREKMSCDELTDLGFIGNI
jgi:hypothetical protein